MESGLAKFKVGDKLTIVGFSSQDQEETYKDNYKIMKGDTFFVEELDGMKVISKQYNKLLAGAVIFDYYQEIAEEPENE